MKAIIAILIFFVASAAYSQTKQLAQYYFERGEFEKALVSFQELYDAGPDDASSFLGLVESLQQLQRFDAAQKIIETRFKKYNEGSALVELGYNFQLQQQQDRAKTLYEQAIKRIEANWSEVSGIATTFEHRGLIDYALRSYLLATQREPRSDFMMQIASLYGQSGDTRMMVDTYLDGSHQNPQIQIMVQNHLSRFMLDDPDGTFSDMLRKALLVRAQKNQDLFWNQFLSWFFVQQKEYGKAFIQEKAIYKREPETFENIVNLAQLAIAEKDDETAREILAFVLANTQDLELLVRSHSQLMAMRIDRAAETDFVKIEADIAALLTEFGASPITLSLQLLRADVLAFHLGEPEAAKNALKDALAMPLNRYQSAQAKMKLADTFLFEEKYNQALLYYSQIGEDMKNDATGHEASLKSAQTSYFKADFDWAQNQFKALKSASTQLIANDALEYFLLIADNSAVDSTRTALKKFARADYLLFRNKQQEALRLFDEILREHKGEEIEPATLLRIGNIHRKEKRSAEALEIYATIIASHPESIYVDEALFFSAQILSDDLNDSEKAKPLLEKIIFSHQDSIHFVEARRRFRQIRGDATL